MEDTPWEKTLLTTVDLMLPTRSDVNRKQNLPCICKHKGRVTFCEQIEHLKYYGKLDNYQTHLIIILCISLFAEAVVGHIH